MLLEASLAAGLPVVWSAFSRLHWLDWQYFRWLPGQRDWISGLTVEQAWGGLLLIGMGLLQLGFAPAVLQTILGLLTTAAGFEIFYASVETSALVAGLLSMTNLGLAMVGAYLLVAPHMEKDE